MSANERNFIGMLSDAEPNRVRYINLDQIRIVDDIRPGHCRIWLSETFNIEVNGAGAALLLARISERAIELDGSPLNIRNENIASVKSSSPMLAQGQAKAAEQ